MQDVNLPGNDINSCGEKADSPWECQKKCKTSQSCRAFTWISKENALGPNRANDCCLKSYFGLPEQLKGLVSGRDSCGGKIFFYVHILNSN